MLSIQVDRGYVDYARLYAVHKQGVLSVIRANDNLKFKRLFSSQKDWEAGIRADQFIALVKKNRKRDIRNDYARLAMLIKSENRLEMREFKGLTGPAILKLN